MSYYSIESTYFCGGRECHFQEEMDNTLMDCIDNGFYLDMEEEESDKPVEKKAGKKCCVEREKNGRLKKGSLLAKKDISEVRIILLYESGVKVKDIVKETEYSKSTVYRIIAKYKKMH